MVLRDGLLLSLQGLLLFETPAAAFAGCRLVAGLGVWWNEQLPGPFLIPGVKMRLFGGRSTLEKKILLDRWVSNKFLEAEA